MENDSALIKAGQESQVFRRQDLTIPYGDVNQEVPHWTREEMRFLLNAVPPDKAMLFQFLWRTGVRVTEAITVLKSHLNFQNDEIVIRWLKNRKAQHRTIPMHSSLKQSLLIYTVKMTYEDRIFPITRQRVDQLCKRYGFGHAHKIRHSYAANFLRQSKSPMAIIELKNLLGHMKIETTMEYLKIVPMQLKESVRQIDFD